MSYVHPFSKRCDKSEIDLFRVPPTQQSLERGRWIDYAPLSSVENPDSAITYLIAGTDEYIDLSKTILTVRGEITKGDGTKLTGGGQTDVAPVNNFLHSLFRQVDVYLNGKQVTPAMGTYPYRAYIETLLNYDASAKESQFTSALYYKDTATKMDDAGALPQLKEVKIKLKNSSETDGWMYTAGTGNQGFAKRSQFIQNGKQFVLSGPIFTDIFMSDRLLLNMMDLKVVLNRSNPKFCLMDKTSENAPTVNPQVKLSEVILKIRKVKVDQAVSDGIERMLKQTPALYPIRRVECKILTVPSCLPTTRQDLDFDEAYNTLFSGTGKIYSNAGLDIDRDEYPGGFALYAFDLTPDMCKSSEYFNTVQRGSLSLALTFREAAKHPLAMVCYGDFENVIRIDAERNAIYDIA